MLTEQTPAFAIGRRKYRLSAGRSARQWNAAVGRASPRSIGQPATPGLRSSVVCPGADCGVSRSSAPMQTTQYGDLQRFFTRCLSVATVSCCPFAARKRHARVCPDNKTCYLQALRETGATGLKPATSGVTGRSWRFRAERGSAGIPPKSGTSDPAVAGIGGEGRELAATSCGMSAGCGFVSTDNRPAVFSQCGLPPATLNASFPARRRQSDRPARPPEHGRGD